MEGAKELVTERLRLRRYRMEDAEALHEKLGADPQMYKYSGWNPYASYEAARESVRAFMDSYDDTRFYGWAIEYNGELAGTVGAYDYDPGKNSIEIGISIERASWGRGFAPEALKCVLEYLTAHEGIGSVTAWCANENTGSIKAMLKAGMKETHVIKNGLKAEGGVYDRHFFRYTAG